MGDLGGCAEPTQPRADPPEGHPLTPHQSVLTEVLSDAHLTDPRSTAAFWNEPLATSREVRQAYRRYSSRVPVKPGVILYETASGDRMNDNPFALFEFLLSHPEYGATLHVWSLGPHGSIPDTYRHLDNVAFAPRTSRAYAYFLACAQRLVGNAHFPEYFARRQEQSYLNTWHGIPFKALGRDAEGTRFGLPSGAATFLKATHVITPGEFTTNALVSAYSMAGASTALVAETGYPRVDTVVNSTPDERAALRTMLGLDPTEPHGERRPVVLYAPTWRGEGGEDPVDTDHLTDTLSALSSLDVQVLYRGHQRIGRELDDQTVGDIVDDVIVPPQELDSNALLTVVDILVTDYSSIFFDFLPTGRPIIHFLYDLADYEASRGLNFGPDELPGTVAHTESELSAAVEDLARAIRATTRLEELTEAPIQGAHYLAARSHFSPFEDGGSSARVANFFFHDDAGDMAVRTVRGEQPTTVFWAGLISEGKRDAEFVDQVIDAAHDGDRQLTLVIDRASTVSAAAIAELTAVKDAVAFIPYNRPAVVTLRSETGAYRELMARGDLRGEAVWGALRDDSELQRLFWYEYRRRLDVSIFDSVMLAPQLSTHETAIAAFATAAGVARPQEVLLPAPRGKRGPHFARSALGLALPQGSERRARAARLYRRLR
ncbi:CDP-glycerol glycerophosphotransferase family protein [Demequina sp.]|uniref:CDP-glycerol glycerophosphotransferase family protein n=1 Tax=Demequina sp. TaxID=2050685 RepID=UPI003D097CAE